MADLLIFGSYPEVLQAKTRIERIEIITEIANSYLLKDILVFDRIGNSRVLQNLLKLLAFQVGSLVSVSELATQLSVDMKTVQRYLDLLEKAFVIYRLNGFSRNLREEIKSKSKYYFYDNGIRNAIIAQFNDIDQRNDCGALWENFLMVERLKYRAAFSLYANMYYWRTYQGKEIDLVEEREGKLYGYEFKYSYNKIPRTPSLWMEAYSNSEYHVIHPQNFWDFVLPEERNDRIG